MHERRRVVAESSASVCGLVWAWPVWSLLGLVPCHTTLSTYFKYRSNMEKPKPIQFTSSAVIATVMLTWHYTAPPPNKVECISLDQKARLWSHHLNFTIRDTAAWLIGKPVFLHVLLLNCDCISLNMFQIRKNSMNIFEIYKIISLFNIYISNYISITYIYC